MLIADRHHGATVSAIAASGTVLIGGSFVMSEIVLSKCGYRCDLCLAYQPNVARNDRRKQLSDGWFDLFGFRIPAESIYCEGCVSSESPVLIDYQCPVRPCAVSRALDHCGQCELFVCEKHKQRGVRRDSVEESIGRPVTQREYELFILPYESEDWLEVLRRE